MSEESANSSEEPAVSSHSPAASAASVADTIPATDSSLHHLSSHSSSANAVLGADLSSLTLCTSGPAPKQPAQAQQEHAWLHSNAAFQLHGACQSAGSSEPSLHSSGQGAVQHELNMPDAEPCEEGAELASSDIPEQQAGKVAAQAAEADQSALLDQSTSSRGSKSTQGTRSQSASAGRDVSQMLRAQQDGAGLSVSDVISVVSQEVQAALQNGITEDSMLSEGSFPEGAHMLQ